MRYESISVVMPAYNESQNIKETVCLVADALVDLCDKWEIVVIDDGSCDDTKDIVETLKSQYRGLRIISHAKNRGYGAAIRTGFKNAIYDYIVLFPADNQFDFPEVSELFKVIGDADIVAGYRVSRRDSLKRRINAFIFNTSIALFFGLRVKDIDCGFKLYKRRVFEKISLTCNGALIDTELLYKAKKRGLVIRQVPLKHKARLHGDSTGGNFKVILYAIREFATLWMGNLFYGSKKI